MKAIEQRKQMGGQGGFTLIELLVVIAILGVLAGVVVFAVGGINNSSQETACKTEVSTVETALGAFYAQENKYPNKADDPAAAGATDGEATPTANGKKFIPGFLKKAPTVVTIQYGATGPDEPAVVWSAAGATKGCGTAGNAA